MLATVGIGFGGREGGREEPTCTVGENVMSSHYGNHYGGTSRK
jgi:hypothetical protein